MRQCFGICNVIYRDEFNVFVTLLHRSAHDVAADTPETVNSDLNTHLVVLRGCFNALQRRSVSGEQTDYSSVLP